MKLAVLFLFIAVALATFVQSDDTGNARGTKGTFGAPVIIRTNCRKKMYLQPPESREAPAEPTAREREAPAEGREFEKAEDRASSVVKAKDAPSVPKAREAPAEPRKPKLEALDKKSKREADQKRNVVLEEVELN